MCPLSIRWLATVSTVDQHSCFLLLWPWPVFLWGYFVFLIDLFGVQILGMLRILQMTSPNLSFGSYSWLWCHLPHSCFWIVRALLPLQSHEYFVSHTAHTSDPEDRVEACLDHHCHFQTVLPHSVLSPFKLWRQIPSDHTNLASLSCGGHAQPPEPGCSTSLLSDLSSWLTSAL